MQLGGNGSHREQRGKTGSREGRGKGGRKGKRDGREGRKGREEKKTELQVPSTAQDPKFSLFFQDSPVKSPQELVESLAGLWPLCRSQNLNSTLTIICNLGQCTQCLIGPSIFISKMRMVRIVHHWALGRIK